MNPLGNRHLTRAGFFCFMAWLLSSCAVFNHNLHEPEVSVINVYALPGDGIEQHFKVILQITNPNTKALKLVGMRYGLNLNGHKVVSGVASGIPEIPAYGQNRVELEAAVNTLASIRLVSQLLTDSPPELNYRFYADLDTGVPLLGSFTVEDSGLISISPGAY